MKTPVLQQFKEMAERSCHDLLGDIKAQGGRVVGLFCSYSPQELIVAAGMVPYRMRAVGSTKTIQGDVWLSSFNCSYVRHLFDLAMDGKFRFLDGLVFVNSCDHLRRTGDIWKSVLKEPAFIKILSVPHKMSDDAVTWYREELNILKSSMEAHFQVAITESALREAIVVCNRTRVLLARLYALRKAENPPITASEVLAVLMTGSSLPPATFAELLEKLLEEISGREVYDRGLPRLMIMSGCLEEAAHLDLIEGLGSVIVDDSLCFGRRYFDRLVQEDADDPLQALAERYLRHLSCPRMGDGFQARMDYVKESAKEYNLDGLIVEKLKFCDLWGGDAFIARREFKKTGLPVLTLEREMFGSGIGQFKTRVQAFLERIGVQG